MHRKRWGMIAVLVAMATLLSPHLVAAHPTTQTPDPDASLSPYWGPAVQRWEPIILEYAQQRGLDPDLIAALIWKESRGQPDARGPAGAVGLMMVMPKEAGFSWRPTAEALEEPWRNVFWGARALSIVIRQSNGDLYHALAAYNGGWEQTHLRGPRRYAADILDTYARAVAVRCGLPAEGHWIATIAPVDRRARSALTVLGPQWPLTRYSARPVDVHIPGVTTEPLPTAMAFFPPDGQDLDSRVGLWIVMDGRIIHGPQGQEASPLDPPFVRTGPSEVWGPPSERGWREV
ncbi:MAG TPA: lytic transglycosylase domain-containing protein [Anaerolineales bacterium]|nr:lytic transglycosylase domain-containing protein [Anaerolineae bacterium]HIQ00836.1 lytic transglycosylase domain-containing protein [Anaerolineales bacterium]